MAYYQTVFTDIDEQPNPQHNPVGLDFDYGWMMKETINDSRSHMVRRWRPNSYGNMAPVADPELRLFELRAKSTLQGHTFADSFTGYECMRGTNLMTGVFGSNGIPPDLNIFFGYEPFVFPKVPDDWFDVRTYNQTMMVSYRGLIILQCGPEFGGLQTGNIRSIPDEHKINAMRYAVRTHHFPFVTNGEYRRNEDIYFTRRSRTYLSLSIWNETGNVAVDYLRNLYGL